MDERISAKNFTFKKFSKLLIFMAISTLGMLHIPLGFIPPAGNKYRNISSKATPDANANSMQSTYNVVIFGGR
jgi:multidrug efflux pump subunit AcrB